jgi:hypothetical protein
MENVKVGDVVIYHDETGTPLNALVKTVWHPTCLNIQHINKNEGAQDNDGRQSVVVTSVCHVSLSSAHGRYWRRVEEQPREYVAPAQS